MNPTQLHYQIALSRLTGIGPARARALVSNTNSVEAIFKEKQKNLQLIPGINANLISKAGFTNALSIAEKEVEYIMKNEIQTFFYLEQNYPRRLKQCNDAPIILYGKGTLNLNPSRILSIVGTRNATSYGNAIVEELLESISQIDATVVSGLALGIDILAHRQCVSKNIPTIGVLGHGLDRMYPHIHKKTSIEMQENGGLLTEYLPGTKPDREHFPMRNRIVAGMCDATVVIESGASGGSLITANLANDYQREVAAFPGDITRTYSKGCNLLIQQNKAHLVTCGADFLKLMNWEPSTAPVIQKNLFIELNPYETLIMNHLNQYEAIGFDQLAELCSFTSGKLSALLLMMEMNGFVRSLPGKRYQSC